MGPYEASRRAVGAIASAALIFVSSSAWAEQPAATAEYAKLIKVQGTVLVDTGTGFNRVLDNTALKLGDRVMVTDGGGALLDFGKDCVVPLQAPSMTTVTETACSVATQGEAPEGNPPNITPIIILVGAGGAALLVACLVDFCDEESDSP